MRSGRLEKHLPDPTVLGRVKSALLMAAFALDPVGSLDRYFMPAGRALEITRLGRGTHRLLFLYDPEYNRRFMLNMKGMRTAGLWPVTAPDGTAQKSLRSHPLKARGPEQATFHEMIDPYLSRGAVNQSFAEIRSIVLTEIATWQPGVHDFYTLARRCTERVAFSLLFGEHESERFAVFGDLLHEYHRANWAPAAHLFPADLPGTAYRRALTQAEALQSYLYAWMKAPSAAGCPRSLLNTLAAAKDLDGCPFSKEQTAGTAAMLAWLSYETMATALTWAVFLLAQHPAVLDDLIDEISAHGAVENASADTLLSLPLLDAVVKEAMRLITPVPIMSFRMALDGEIANQSFPRRSRFFVVSHLTHRLPELYPAPDRFRPGRWFSIKPSPYEYMPFGAGQRLCPGTWLAMTNLKLVLATLLGRFRPTIPSGARIDRLYAVVTMPRNGVPMDLVPRGHEVGGRPNFSYSGSIFDLFTPEPERAVLH
jgi:cytochrome P450